MERLRHRADFLAASSGLRASSAAFVLLARRRDDDGPPRVGFTVSRKVGTAVERNRVRRRLKEMMMLAATERVRPGHDYVLVARRAALARPFEQLVGDFSGAVLRLGPGRPPRKPSSAGKSSKAARAPKRPTQAGMAKDTQ